MKCPICKNHELATQSLEDTHGNDPDVFCPEIIKLPTGRIFNHYREHYKDGQLVIQRIFAMPYRIITKRGESQISVLSKYRSGAPYFKTMLKVPAVHADLEENIIKRVKLLLLFS